jgi:uncharacterized protein (TIGR04255 family)
LTPVGPTSVRKNEFTEWNFYGRKREKRASITPHFFFVSDRSYTSFANLREGFLALVNSFFESFNDAQPSRLGLRYINTIKAPNGSPLDWKKNISSELLGLFSFSIPNAEPSRIFHNVEFTYEGFNLRFQFGIHNPDYPAPIRQRVFILDFDAYHQGLLQSTELPQHLDNFHKEIQILFERAITPEFRELLNAE